MQRLQCSHVRLCRRTARCEARIWKNRARQQLRSATPAFALKANKHTRIDVFDQQSSSCSAVTGAQFGAAAAAVVARKIQSIRALDSGEFRLCRITCFICVDKIGQFIVCEKRIFNCNAVRDDNFKGKAVRHAPFLIDDAGPTLMSLTICAVCAHAKAHSDAKNAAPNHIVDNG